MNPNQMNNQIQFNNQNFQQQQQQQFAQYNPNAPAFNGAAPSDNVALAGFGAPGEVMHLPQSVAGAMSIVGDMGLGQPQQQQQQQPPQAAAPAPSGTHLAYLSERQFAELPGLAPVLARGLREELGFQFMTKVQAATFDPVVAGKNVIAKARTGTGKTLGFMLPVLQRLEQAIQFGARHPSGSSNPGT